MRWHTRRKQISSFGETDRVHLNRRGRQFSRLLAAELCASAVVMLDTPCSEVVWRVLATHYIRQFPLHFPSLRNRVPSHFNWTLRIVFGGGVRCGPRGYLEAVKRRRIGCFFPKPHSNSVSCSGIRKFEHQIWNFLMHETHIIYDNQGLSEFALVFNEGEENGEWSEVQWSEDLWWNMCILLDL